MNAVTNAISLYDADAAWMGEAMAEPAFGTASETEISERSKGLVLPDAPSVPDSGPVRDPAEETGLSELEASKSAAAGPSSATPLLREAAAEWSGEAQRLEDGTASPPSVTERGVALPGDRGPRSAGAPAQRPSFWRRIALGARRASPEPVVESAVAPTRPTASPASTDAVDQRIVEPLLQALVSVEAKLERSHVELVGRSDQVEQRLTQLWDIEEQLGSLGELQESLLRVSEQQRRLEAAISDQTRLMRWLVGAICVSLAAAAFVVALVLR